MISLCLMMLLAQDGQVIPFNSPRWVMEGGVHRVETWQEKQSLALKGATAIIKDSHFTNGTIQFDMAIPKQRGFMGVIWRIQDSANFEEFYIRSHQSGNPDANQYTPVFNGMPGWQLYHGAGYGSAVAYKYDQWFPVKLVVSGAQAEIYLDDMQRPALFMHQLKRDQKAGQLGLRVLNFSEGRFANFRFTHQSAPELVGRAPAAEPQVPGIIDHWKVSDTFAESKLEGTYQLGEIMQARTWKTLEAEPDGITNLARVAAVTREARTLLACFELEAKQDMPLRLRFGYSDRVKLYLNGNMLYAGTNRYRSRDYRYLGTIGLFDQVVLPLKMGRNQVQLAVSEDFGGWGVMAALDEHAEVGLIKP